jgi:cell division septation protein DedD
MVTLFDILIVAAVLGFAFWGWRLGGAAATAAALEVVACLAIAVLLHEWLAGWLHVAVVMAFGDSISSGWSVLVAFAILAWGTFAVLRGVCHAKGAEDADADVDPLVDGLAGAVGGLVGGALFVGGVLVTLSMVPFLAGIKPSGDRILLDAGKLALRTAGHFVRERHEGRPVPVWGEPASRSSVASARLTSEPWFDADADGAFTDADRYRDVDGNGTFSKDLFYTDLDGDGLRRIGMLDKYVAGRWDAQLISAERSRPDAAKPAPAAHQPKPGDPQKAGGSTPAPAPKPDPKPDSKPAPKPVQKPVQKPGQKPGQKPEEKPEEKPIEADF